MIALACISIGAVEGLVAGVLAGAMIGAFGGTVFEGGTPYLIWGGNPETG